jgi:hypothetical protein
MFDGHSFLSQSDWTLAASGVAREQDVTGKQNKP